MGLKRVYRLAGEWFHNVDVRVHGEGEPTIAIVEHHNPPSARVPWEVDMSLKEAADMAKLLTRAVALAEHAKAGGCFISYDEDALAEFDKAKPKAAAE